MTNNGEMCKPKCPCTLLLVLQANRTRSLVLSSGCCNMVMFPTGRTASFGLPVCQPHNLSSSRNLGGITISRFASLPSNSIRIKTPISDGFNLINWELTNSWEKISFPMVGQQFNLINHWENAPLPPSDAPGCTTFPQLQKLPDDTRLPVTDEALRAFFRSQRHEYARQGTS